MQENNFEIDEKLKKVMACPRCHSDIGYEKERIFCKNSACTGEYFVKENIPVFIAGAPREEMNGETEVSILLPCYDESENLKVLLPQIREIIGELGINWEMIVIDKFVDDRTRVIAESNGASYVRQSSSGYGEALREGFAAARGNYVLALDADLSHNPHMMENMILERKSADLLIASRYVKFAHSALPFLRRVFSRILNFVYAKSLSMPVNDCSCGYRLYSRRLLNHIEITERNYSVLQEILIQAYMEGFDIRELPFHARPRRAGYSKAKLLRFGAEYLRNLYKWWKKRNSLSAADYEERAFFSIVWPQRYWQRRRYNTIVRFTPNDNNIVEIGCGSGKVLEAFPQGIGVDILFNKLRYKKKNTRRLIHASIFELPLKNGSMEVVICSQLIEHVAKDRMLFVELNRILKQDGILVLGTPDYGNRSWLIIEWIYGKLLPNAYTDEHISHYNYKELCEILAEFGFEVLEHDYILHGELIIKAKKVRDLLGY